MFRKTWLKFGRDDLHGIPFMQANGYEVIFSQQDKMNNRVTPDLMPTDSVGFKKENIFCWKSFDTSTIHRDVTDVVYNWQTARLVKGYFVEHKRFNNLEDIVKHYL
jgi:hypothetical protein